MKAKITDLGRHKWSGEISFTTLRGLEQQIKKHLMSREIDLFIKDETHGSIEAGFHTVGQIELLDCSWTTYEQDIIILDVVKKK